MGRQEARGGGRGAKAGALHEGDAQAALHPETHLSIKHRAEHCSPCQIKQWRRVRVNPEVRLTLPLPFCTALPALIIFK